jgi:epoxyqueuosine reductase
VNKRSYYTILAMNNMLNMVELAEDIKTWARTLGFQHVGITDCDLQAYTPDFATWLAKGFHGELEYMARHRDLRENPEQLLPNTLRIISVGMHYLPPDTQAVHILHSDEKAYISRYALGGDYHKFIRKRLTQLADKIQGVVGEFGYRAFSDSAPILEKPLGVKAGLGWIGKNTLLMNKTSGSWFFLGELFTDLPLPIETKEQDNACGKCTACIAICPTGAIVAPYQLDARRCISYLTIELKTAIPEKYRPLIGNRIYGCDDCQLVCPWNRFAKPTDEGQFHPRHDLDDRTLIELFHWSEETFLKKTEGSAIRRIGYDRWMRNLAVALGNAPTSEEILSALKAKLNYPDLMVREHIIWALNRHLEQKNRREDTMRFKLTQKLNTAY